MTHEERLAEIAALANSIGVGWRESLPRDVLHGLSRIEELAIAEQPPGFAQAAFHLVPNQDEITDEGRQYGWTLERDGQAVMLVTTGGTGACWNLDLLGSSDGASGTLGPLAGAGNEEVHVCKLEDLIAALEFLRDSDENRRHRERWGRD